jgi:hypothetical protein
MHNFQYMLHQQHLHGSQQHNRYFQLQVAQQMHRSQTVSDSLDVAGH